MKTLTYYFGTEKELNVEQMCVRAFTVFVIAIFFIRISGRRSFGLRMPLDVVISILLGGMLGRAIVGASPFVPSIMASLVLVALHRIAGLLARRIEFFSVWINGTKKVVYENGKFIQKNMQRCMVSEHDLKEGLRDILQDESFEKVETVIVERNGTISIIRKKEKPDRADLS
jgi:uncharacterized membrane protein YcaP (DUF421 family)